MAIEITSKKFLSPKEIEVLLESLKLLSLRDALLIKMLMNLGMRGSELLEVTVGDIDFDDMSIHVIGKKGSKSRKLPIPLSLKDELFRYVLTDGNGKSARLFDIRHTTMKTIWYKIRPNKSKGIHSLRHTFAINLFKKHRDIKLVQMFLGHRNIQNTMIYADYVYSTEEMSQALGGGLYVS